MKILLVYPHYPDTFWSFRYALKFIDRKASFPPLGLLTVAAMLPGDWEKRLIDMNVGSLGDADLEWADYVFISAMTIQRESAQEVIARCRRLGVKSVAGGPLFTSWHDEFPDVDHLVLGEAELTLPPFLADLCNGKARPVYADNRRADITKTVIPLWKLIDVRNYAAMNIQYCRGCPFDCEFCDITALLGKKPRSKTLAQLIAELDSLYISGWRGAVFFVDDNFIGDKGKLKREVLPALIGWMQAKGHPFYFYTEASIDLADDGQLMALMVRAGFEEVFIGIETPHEGGLVESGKAQNRNRDLLASVKCIQRAGLQVHGGFIVGFDSDSADIFDRQIRFIQESGIVTAMVGVLIALRGTRLYQRLQREGRLLGNATGNNTAIAMNFIPRMDLRELISGYQTILGTIYSPKNYYRRVISLLKEYRPTYPGKFHLQQGYVGALFKSILFLGVLGMERLHFWKLFFWSLARRPRQFPLAITY
ncbi:MAG: DUF4070 domain-containing protein, partial [Pseudomonadota bacterium]